MSCSSENNRNLTEFKDELLDYLYDYVDFYFREKAPGLYIANHLSFCVCLDFRQTYNCYILKRKHDDDEDPLDAPKIAAIEFAEYNDHTASRMMKFVKSEWKYYDDNSSSFGGRTTTKRSFTITF